MKIIRDIFISIGAAFLINQIQIIVGSSYVVKFLDSNLLTLLIALMAINTTSLGIVLSKVRELIDSSDSEEDFFPKTKKAMYFSIVEQILLIFISLIVLTLLDSTLIQNHQDFVSILRTALIACFVYGMLILFDTANSVFIILSFKKKTK